MTKEELAHWEKYVATPGPFCWCCKTKQPGVAMKVWKFEDDAGLMDFIQLCPRCLKKNPDWLPQFFEFCSVIREGNGLGKGKLRAVEMGEVADA
mgnify:CR=1 FL=1|tara:strand:+ start:608 stop:889 length:282 start_codon:yes stop_codon:yes gene_type:complete